LLTLTTVFDVLVEITLLYVSRTVARRQLVVVILETAMSLNDHKISLCISSGTAERAGWRGSVLRGTPTVETRTKPLRRSNRKYTMVQGRNYEMVMELVGAVYSEHMQVHRIIMNAQLSNGERRATDMYGDYQKRAGLFFLETEVIVWNVELRNQE
jgi:hypothetical protein